MESTILLREDLIAEKRVLEPERGKIETYVKCKVDGGWFWVEGGICFQPRPMPHQLSLRSVDRAGIRTRLVD